MTSEMQFAKFRQSCSLILTVSQFGQNSESSFQYDCCWPWREWALVAKLSTTS